MPVAKGVRSNQTQKISQISYTVRVIVNFVPNFVAMAIREGPG